MSRRSAWTVVLAAVIVAQTGLVFWLSRPWGTPDTARYLELGHALSQGCFGAQAEGTCRPEGVRSPGYPVVLALLLNGVGMPIAVLVLLQLLLYLLSATMAWATLNAFGRHGQILLVVLLGYPFAAAYSARVMTEAWSLALVTTAVMALIHPRLPGRHVPLLAGIGLGLAVLFRGDLLLLPFLVALALLPRRRAAAAVAGAAALMMLPYAAYNAVHFSTVVPVPAAGALGNSLYLATWESRLSEEDFAALWRRQMTPHARAVGFAEELGRINEALGAPAYTPPINPEFYPSVALQMRATRAFGREAVRRISAEPLDYASHVVRGWWRLFNTLVYPDTVGRVARLGLAVASSVVWFLGLVGALQALRDARLRVLGLTVFYFPAIHGFLHTEARYTATARLLLVFCAALALERLLLFAQSSRIQKSPGGEEQQPVDRVAIP